MVYNCINNDSELSLCCGSTIMQQILQQIVDIGIVVQKLYNK